MLLFQISKPETTLDGCLGLIRPILLMLREQKGPGFLFPVIIGHRKICAIASGGNTWENGF
jgi:hypothetical protein